MVRTKRSAAPKTGNVGANNALKAVIEAIESRCLKEIKDLRQKAHTAEENKYRQLRLLIPKNLLKRTFEEVINGDVPDSDFSTTALSGTLLNDITNNITENKTSNVKLNQTVTKAKRSRSYDDGYTSESTRSTHSGGRTTRQSRSKARSIVKDSARSLTRTRDRANSSVTPLNKRPPVNAGSITPKVKPNTPLLCMRRPKIGEIAWSNQGSPLLVNVCAGPDNAANINIPIRDNEMISILPERGPIRRSQIPEFDSDTRRQLEILRDNLIKVCENSKLKD